MAVKQITENGTTAWRTTCGIIRFTEAAAKFHDADCVEIHQADPDSCPECASPEWVKRSRVEDSDIVVSWCDYCGWEDAA